MLKNNKLSRVTSLVIAVCLLGAFGVPVASGAVSAYQIASAGDLLTGGYADGEVADFMLENDFVAVVISRISHDVPPTNTGGNIIDAGSSIDRVDALGSFYTYFDDDWPRQADYQTLVIVDNGAGGGPAVIRVTGHDSDAPSLTVVTDYSLDDGARYVSVSTTVTNVGGGTYANFELGDAFHWGECSKFAPGYGFNLPGDSSEPWLAGTAEQVSYGYTSPPETLWGPNGSYWSDVNVTTVRLEPDDSETYTRHFVVGGRDIASVATIVHEIAGAPVGTVECTVSSEADGEPLDRATIDTYDDLEAIYLQMETDPDGSAATTLSPGDWRLVASAIGYQSEETWISVTEGETTDYDFTLVPGGTEIMPIGDTLTVIQQPLLNIPTVVMPGDTFDIECDADPATDGWAATLLHGNVQIPLNVLSSVYDSGTHWWKVSVLAPEVPIYELYDLRVTADGGIEDVTRNAVRIIPEFKDDYYFIQITDTHLPTHLYNYETGAETDTSEVIDLREVIADLNIINPEFVLLTGDLLNEGELEDYLGWRYYTRAQRMLTEFQVPVYLIAGNHDIGGWVDTPPPAGTARRDWWRFFGWKRLDDPPAGAPWYTQNYSFDYGPVHYVALEAYDNYDMWRSEIYGAESFTDGQLQWLASDLAGAAGSAAQVLFYHYDFSYQLDLDALGLEMALWGHIHRDEGDPSSPPYNLSTNNVCDGERSYRLVRVSSGELTPSLTVSAGQTGQNLSVQYVPANDGTHMEVTAEVDNNLDERFEHAQLRFLMPNLEGTINVSGGDLFQVDDSDSVAVCYVDVDILPGSFQVVTVTLDSSDVVDDDPLRHQPWLDQNRPNPFGPGTVLRYGLPRSSHVRLAVHELSGREVAVLIDETRPAGKHLVRWEGRDSEGRMATAGTYLARLVTRDRVVTRKIILVR